MSTITMKKQANGLPQGPVPIIDSVTGEVRHATALERAMMKLQKMETAVTAQRARCVMLKDNEIKRADREAAWQASQSSRPEDLRAKAMALLAKAEEAEAAAIAAARTGKDGPDEMLNPTQITLDGLNDFIEENSRIEADPEGTEFECRMERAVPNSTEMHSEFHTVS